MSETCPSGAEVLWHVGLSSKACPILSISAKHWMREIMDFFGEITDP